MVKRPLEGKRVLDLTRVLAGPFCTMQLADMGAEVIKIELVGRGDDSRFFGPFLGEESAYFSSLNRNKKSMTLNLKQEKGRDIFKELVKKAHVLVENFRPGTMEGLGLGYETLSSINPRLVYGAISGFGGTGPDAHKPAYDIIVQARGGIMSITGTEGGEPTRVGASIGDIAAALFAVNGILSALLVVCNGGDGQKVDVSMLDTQVALLENAIARHTVTGETPIPLGNRHPSITPFSLFEARDTSLVVAAGNDRLFHRLCRLLNLPHLVEDERFKDNARRTAHAKALYPLLQDVFATREASYWCQILEEEKIPCALIQDISQVLMDPQLQAREMIRELPLSSGQVLPVAGIPLKFSRTVCQEMTPPPRLGEHTEEILTRYLGFGKEEYRTLKAHKIV